MKNNWIWVSIFLFSASVGWGAELTENQSRELIQRTFRPLATAYEGRMLLTRWYGDKSQTEELEVHFRPPSFYRWEYLKPDGSPARIVISNANTEEIFVMDNDTVLRGQAVHSSAKHMVPDQEWKLLLQNYKVQPKGTQHVAGRPSWVIEITPIHDGKPSEILWIDQELGLMLESKRFRPQGKLAATAQFVRFHAGVPVPLSLFKMVKEGDKRVEEHGYNPDFLTIEEFIKLTSRKPEIPTTLPMGFAFESADSFQVDSRNVDHFRFTDGLAVLSVFETKFPVRIPGNNTRQSYLPFRGPNLIETNETGHVLQKNFKDKHFTLIGDVSEDALRTIAQSLK
jgi:negative regulator of sigma E activity